MIRAVVAVLLIVMAPMGYSATAECTGTVYERGLCLYTDGSWSAAEGELESVLEEGRRDHETLKAIYFLSRTKMRLQKWDEASDLLIRLFELDPSFYRQWNGDHLLGECRQERGVD